MKNRTSSGVSLIWLGRAYDGDDLAQDDGIICGDRLVCGVARQQPHVAVQLLQCFHGGLGGRGPFELGGDDLAVLPIGWCRTTTRSPSVIAAPVIESPLTFSTNSFP